MALKNPYLGSNLLGIRAREVAHRTELCRKTTTSSPQLRRKIEEDFRISGWGCRVEQSQTPGRIQKVDPLRGVAIKYPSVARVPNLDIYFLDPPGGLG